MRIFIFFTLFFLSSCKSTSTYMEDDHINDTISNPGRFGPIIEDENGVVDYIEPIVDYVEYIEPDYIEPDYIEYNIDPEYVESYPIIIEESKSAKKQNSLIITNNTSTNNTSTDISTDFNIIDLTNDSEKSDGTIAYNVPSDFEVNKYSTIKLRISYLKKIESIIIGNRNIPIVKKGSSDDIIVESIKVDSIMSAVLYTDDGFFEVSMVGDNAEQTLSEDGYTEWVWRIRPLKPGDHYIKMIITISGRDIVVYEKNIPVQSNWVFSFSEWFLKWWKEMAGITTTIFIPLFTWLYRKRKDKKDKKESN